MRAFLQRARAQLISIVSRVLTRPYHHHTISFHPIGQQHRAVCPGPYQHIISRHPVGQQQQQSTGPGTRILVEFIAEYVGEESIDLGALRDLRCTQWAAWGATNWAAERLTGVLAAWHAGGTAEAGLKASGVGPWTRKAFGLMCRGADLLLHEDRWVQARWTQLCRLARLPHLALRDLEQQDAARAASKPPSRPTLRATSLTLWRITPPGIASLAARQTLALSAFV
jgi:hypothetical protein